MILLDFRDICVKCAMADLELECFEIESWDEEYSGKWWSVKCKHEEVCHRWNYRLNDKKVALYEKIANLKRSNSNTEAENG